MITVAGHNACGDGNSSITPITVKLFPVPAGTITGITTLCQGQTGLSYSTSNIAGASSYIWTLPAGATITSGSGTSSIIVSFDSTALSGTITVRGHSADCGNGIPSSLAITVNPLPSPAGIISGTTPVCQGQTGISYSIPVIPNATTYVWTLPTGCTIIGGAGTNSIITSFSTSAVSGVFSVHGHNETCGDGRHNSLPVMVNPLPIATGNISGASPVCQGEPDIPYSIQFIDPLSTSYVWNLVPMSAGVLSGLTSTITITWDNAFTGSASLHVHGLNSCGSGPISPSLSILVNPKPNVSFLDCNDQVTTKNARPVVLKGGYPMGTSGIYSGIGISQTIPGTFIFDPGSSAVIGSSGGTPYTITYRYTNIYSCFREGTRIMKVYPSNATQPCPGTVIDLRDGKSYLTFLAGSRTSSRCWMAENLNYGTFTNGNQPQSDNCIVEKYCINDLSTQCTVSGGYYQWNELMNYNAAEGAQGMCMPGWHIPSQQEWADLENFYLGTGLAGNALKDIYSTHGFHGLLSGVYYLNNIWKYTAGSNTGAMFWSSTSTLTGLVIANGINSFNPSTSQYQSSNGNAFPVRCVRD